MTEENNELQKPVKKVWTTPELHIIASQIEAKSRPQVHERSFSNPASVPIAAPNYDTWYPFARPKSQYLS